MDMSKAIRDIPYFMLRSQGIKLLNYTSMLTKCVNFDEIQIQNLGRDSHFKKFIISDINLDN